MDETFTSLFGLCNRDFSQSPDNLSNIRKIIFRFRSFKAKLLGYSLGQKI